MNFDDTVKMALNGEMYGRLIDEYLDVLIQKNNLIKPTDDEMKIIRKKALEKMQEKYPTAGIKLIKEE